MLWSALKSAWSFLWSGSDHEYEKDEHNLEEEEKEILYQINNFKNLNVDHLEIDNSELLLGCANYEGPILKTENYLCKTGTVTYLCDYYGLINGSIYFDVGCISPNVVVNKGDKVSYITAPVSSPDEPGKIYKICGLSDESWDLSNAHAKFSCGDSIMECKALRRVVNGKVSKLKDRKFFVVPHNIWCDMNKTDTSFEPIEGDWVSLEAAVSVDFKALDWAGEILDIIKVKPTMAQNGTGRVSFWVNGKNEGVINNSIVFDKTVCDDMYLPSLGDLVSYEAIESDQVKFKWRAIMVKPDKLGRRESKEKRLLKNKKGIVITQSLEVIDLKVNETKNIIIEVINRGNTERTLLKTKFYKKDTEAESQLSLISPNLTEKFTLKPAQKLTFVVTCTGKTLGSTGELLEFHFEKFRIAKSFEINVLTDDCINELSQLQIGGCTTQKKTMKKNYKFEGHSFFKGSRPYECSRFNNETPKERFDVPASLWHFILGPGNIPKSSSHVINSIRQYIPYLAGSLNSTNYVKRFRTLLYLEEIAIKIKFSSYTITEGTLQKKDAYWFIEVPGLAEGRPSILVGDKVTVTMPWLSKDVHIGFVHVIERSGIYIDFHHVFNLGYKGEKCDVEFFPNRGTFLKCHQALAKTFEKLGNDWFFPSAVIEKRDRISFRVADELVHRGDLKERRVEEGTKTLTWKNKNFNERQKMAVVNVLRGLARPMPYIIFGPPGTGKTTTVVEMIIQVYFLMPNSRVLVCGPSNSSIDLLTERLIDYDIYKPGELIRLYAVSRLQWIPEKLKPYSDCVKAKNERREDNEAGRKVKGSKVTLGTFSVMGDLCRLMSFKNHTFTHIFIDEAGQMTEPETLITLQFFAKDSSQLVLAGDPKQLGPVCTSVVAAKFDFERSFLERLISAYPYKADRKAFPDTSGFDPRLVTKLTVNYRSLPEIINLPNELFYDSDLVPMISDEDSFEAELLRRIDIKVPEREKHPAIIFHGVFGKNLQEENSPSWFNLQEILQLVVYLKKIYKSGLTADDVGIVTPYIKQVQKCRSILTSVNLAIPEIGTVNNFQGQEKHVILLSTVRSSVELLKKDLLFSLGFVASPRRLNVALTRARTLLIILGNPNLLRTDPYWERVIEYCIKNNSYVGCNIKSDIKFSDSNDQDKD